MAAARGLVQALGVRVAGLGRAPKVSRSLLPREAAQVAAPRRKPRAAADAMPDEGAAARPPVPLLPESMDQLPPALEPALGWGAEIAVAPTQAESVAAPGGATTAHREVSGSEGPAESGGALAPLPLTPAAGAAPRVAEPAVAQALDDRVQRAEAPLHGLAATDAAPAAPARVDADAPSGRLPAAADEAAELTATIAAAAATGDAVPESREAAAPFATSPGVVAGAQSVPPDARLVHAAPDRSVPLPDALRPFTAPAVGDDAQVAGIDPVAQGEGRGAGGPLPVSGDADVVAPEASAAAAPPSDMAAVESLPPPAAASKELDVRAAAAEGEQGTGQGPREADGAPASPGGQSGNAHGDRPATEADRPAREHPSASLAPLDGAAPDAGTLDMSTRDTGAADTAAPDVATLGLTPPDPAAPDVASGERPASQVAVEPGRSPATPSSRWRRRRLPSLGWSGAGRGLVLGALLVAVVAAADALLQWGGYGGGAEPRAVTLVPERAGVDAPVVQVRLELASGLLDVAARANPAPAGHVYHLRLRTAQAGSHLLGAFTTSLSTQTDLVRAMGDGGVDEARLSVTLDPLPVGDAPGGDGIEVFAGQLLLRKPAP